MARNKRLQDREEKQKEIISAARTLFLNEGYDATSMSRIANIAGVAPNTIYWYFKDKDELLITILNAELTERFSGYIELQEKNIVERLLWVIDQFKLVKQLVTTVHARLHVSSEINIWHERFHILVENLLRQELQQLGVEERRIEAKVKVAIFTVEGLLAHELMDEEKHAICSELFQL
ncbi:TetR/AcrR family transcriptional regulator [Acinetobacter sp. C26M]|uniref:TetR/AcrR family transcriptional regulator n=1 Tax=Acinetobacter proteolyticus TaxID=1776741 RepID=A0A2N0WAY9_9GAMM|nr:MULTISPECIES: TetR/AcrR family transcriptional regulator [Acinetobacter]PKF31663.1 TetR/AcrR family transcriptional regulator [Acinetobacter proteolyticus]USA47451.1 TetR/AcrR family transcriptional regulator [Acinetobacter sp. C26M]USA50932.1 TetR/AcrR family transcriptional regulator [Acinetobacter sp. C26G]